MCKLTEERKVTIPKEILACCPIDFTKKVYLYNDGISFLSNEEKDDHSCFGVVKVDHDSDIISFEVPQNLINTNPFYLDHDLYFYVQDGNLYFSYQKNKDTVLSEGKIFTIPEEIASISDINLEEPIYLYKSDRICSKYFYLGNGKEDDDDSCFGKINLDENLSFEAPDAMLEIMREQPFGSKVTTKNISAYAKFKNDKIYLIC